MLINIVPTKIVLTYFFGVERLEICLVKLYSIIFYNLNNFNINYKILKSKKDAA